MGECPSLGGEDANGLGTLLRLYFLEGRFLGVCDYARSVSAESFSLLARCFGKGCC
jgi:hypothetical protein